MKIFLSYARERISIAEEVKLALEADGHDVFYDREDLPPGRSYHSRIRNNLHASELIVFLLSKEFLQPRKYTLSELELAKERWPQPSSHVLPVIVAPVPLGHLDPYLRSVTVLQPKGNVAAEISAAIGRSSGRRLAKVHDLIVKRNFGAAAKILQPIISENPIDPRANLYLAVARLAGRSPRLLDPDSIREVEDSLGHAAKGTDTRADALSVLAIVKYEYYLRNSLRERPPRFAEIVADLKQSRHLKLDPKIIFAVNCPESTRLLIS